MAINSENINEFVALAQGTSGAKSEPSLNIPQTPPQGNQQQVQQPSFNPQSQAQQQPTGYAPQGVQVGAGLLNGGMEYDVPFNASSSKVQAFLEKFEEAAAKQTQLAKNKGSWDLLVFDGRSNHASVSAILFCRRSEGAVAVYPMLVQDTAEPIPDTNLGYANYGGMINQPVTLPRLTEEILTTDKYLSEAIPEFVRRNYAAKGNPDVFMVQGINLPPELSPENSAQIARVLFYANAACESLLFELTGAPHRFSLAAKSVDEHLTLKFDFNEGQVANGVGLPVRSDVSIKLFVQSTSNKDKSIGKTGNHAFSIVNGFMSLQYAPQQQQMMMPNGMPMMFAGATQMFQPVFIINRLDNQFGRACLETQLLALATASSLVRDNAWYGLYEPNYSAPADGTDPRDIGLITLDVNAPGEERGYTPTKNNPDPNFSVPAFLFKYLHQNVLFQLDVPELGDLTYLQRAFIDAAGLAKGQNAQQVQQNAHNAIINAANYLTNGVFAKYWTTNEPIVYNEVGRIELGYYLNEKGEYRDLHEIDYLRLLAVGGGQVEHARAYMDSLNVGTGDEMIRFLARQKIYQTFFTGYQLRGFARRLTINSKFLVALGQALSECGGVINVEYRNHNGAMGVDRSYHNQVLGIGMNGVAGFAQGSWGIQGGNGYNGYSGQWGRILTPQFAVYGTQPTTVGGMY